MDAIAQAAGTTKASLYARFDSKEAVFSAVLDAATRARRLAGARAAAA